MGGIVKTEGLGDGSMCRKAVMIYGDRAGPGAIPIGGAGVVPLVWCLDEAFSYRIVVDVAYCLDEDLDAYEVPVITPTFLPELIGLGWLARSQEP